MPRKDISLSHNCKPEINNVIAEKKIEHKRLCMHVRNTELRVEVRRALLLHFRVRADLHRPWLNHKNLTVESNSL